MHASHAACKCPLGIVRLNQDRRKIKTFFNAPRRPSRLIWPNQLTWWTRTSSVLLVAGFPTHAFSWKKVSPIKTTAFLGHQILGLGNWLTPSKIQCCFLPSSQLSVTANQIFGKKILWTQPLLLFTIPYTRKLACLSRKSEFLAIVSPYLVPYALVGLLKAFAVGWGRICESRL